MIEGTEEVDTLPITGVHQTALTVEVGAVEMVGIGNDTIVIHVTGALALLSVAVEEVTNPVQTDLISIITIIMAMATAVRPARLPILIFRRFLRFHHYPDWKLELLLEPILLPQIILPVYFYLSLCFRFQRTSPFDI